MFLAPITLVIVVASSAYSANILAIMPTPSYSHQVAFFDFWNELSLRGHQVTFITTDPQKNEKLTNLTEIDVSYTYKFYKDIGTSAEKTMTTWNMHNWFYQKSLEVSEAQLLHPEVQDLIHGKDKHFDVLLVESFYPEFLGFAEKYGCPIILINSMEVYASVHHMMGNVANPILYPDIGSPLHAPLDFRERLISTIYFLYTSLFYKYVSFPGKDKIIRRFFNISSTSHELVNRVDMLFLNANPVIQPVRAISPTTVNVDGLRQLSTNPLPKDIADFLDDAIDGFVYFSLGSNVKSKDLQEESLQAIVETFSELPYKVLWKFEADADTIPRKLDNVKLIKWAPQLGVLAHPNIKVFVTQGGLQSMEESIRNEVPCVVIPFFADQQQNARLMKSKGISVTVGRHPHVNKEELKNAILEVIRNSEYKNAVRKINKLSLDTPMTALEKAIWWTEYVIRNKGAKHLRNPAADLPLYQYYLLDVVGFLIFVAVVTFSALFFILKKVYSWLGFKFSHQFHLTAKKNN